MNFKNLIFSLILILLVVDGSLFGQAGKTSIIIKGTVTAKSNGETIVGASVLEKNAENRVVTNAITDINGQYVIKIKDPNNSLEFSYIGYRKLVVKISGRSIINAALDDDVVKMEEFTVTAKATQYDGTLAIPKREISGAMQTISTKEFEGVQATTIDEAIQGRIAGLDIVSNSGDPGSGTSMRIRGASSINSTTQPLIVINGIPFESEIDKNFDFANANQEQFASMLSINPEDIQDITVTKDAASTAQWGSKGANGVISITTKKGAKGKTAISYTYRFTRKVQPRGKNLLSGDDYTMMIKQALFNPFQNDNASNVPEYNYDPTFSEYENFNNNTDWYNEVVKPGYTHDHYIVASGGDDRATYRVSGGFLSETGTIIGQKLSRISSRAYLDYKVSDRLKFISEFSFTYTNNDKNYINNSDNKMSILDIAYNKLPNLSVYAQDLNGNNTSNYYNIPLSSGIGSSQIFLKNPVALAMEAINNSKNYRITPTLRLQYDLLDPNKQYLRYNVYVSFDLDNTKNTMFLSKKALNLPLGSDQINRAEEGDILNLTIQTDNNITWMPKFSNKNHDLLVYGSFQLRTGKSSPFGATSNNIPTIDITDPTAGGRLTGLYSTPGEWRSMAVMGRAHYVYKSKYILDLTLRRDGSTKFGQDQKFGNFPGISAKWIVSDEPFMKSTSSWLSMLAIRPSWGISGRQPDNEYLYQSRYSPYGYYMDIPGYVPSNIPLTNLRWEKSMAYNLGMDLAFLNDKLVFDLNGYYQWNTDILFKNVPISEVSGYSVLPWANLGTMENIGWEVNFNGNQVIKYRDFSVDFQFNLANNKNTLISLDDLLMNSYNQPYSYNNGEYLGRIQEGNAWGSIYGFKFKGVYQYNDYIPGVQENAPVARDASGKVLTDYYGNPLPMKFAYGVANKEYTFKGGDAIYEDVNHDGSIDQLDIVYLGNSNPKLTGGFGTTLRYKSLSLTAFFNFRYGNKIVNIARMNAENMYSDNNQSISVNYRWRKDGDVTNMPRALYNYGYNWLGSDRYVEDGSFVRFKYLTLRYTAPLKYIKMVGLRQVNFYFTINNLAVMSSYTGVDPEVGYGGLGDNGMCFDRSRTPRSKDFTLGLTIGF